MKTLKRLAILTLILVKTTPQIIQTYKQVYNNIIIHEEDIIKKLKSMYSADENIKTTKILQKDKYDIPEEKRENAERLRKRQRRAVNARYLKKFSNYKPQEGNKICQ